MEPTSRAGLTPAYIEQARILDVNIDTYTVSIATAFSKKPQTGISFATPYQHYNNGEGIYFMPEVGSLCWVCFPSDGFRPFVLAWAAASTEGDFRSRKQSLNPGDIYFGTRDDNFVVLRRGGVVEIGGGPLCQRIFMPVNNSIQDFCENYGLHSIAGDLEWNVSIPEHTTDGNRPCSFLVQAKEFADDPNPIAFLEIGSHQADPDSILNVDKSLVALSLIINASGQSGAAGKITMVFNKDGSVIWDFQSTMQWTTEGDIDITSSNGHFNVSAKDLAQITADALTFTAGSSSGALLQALGGYVDIKGSKGVRITGPGFKSLQVDGAKYPVLLATPAILAWFFTHSHPVSGAVAGPSVTPPLPTDFVSKSIFSS